MKRGVVVLTTMLLTQVYAGTLTEMFFQPSPRAHSVMVADTNDDRIVLYGGDDMNNSGTYHCDVWELDPVNEYWNCLDVSGQPPSSRTWCASVYDDAEDRAIIFGGYYTGYFYNDVWELDLTAGSETWQMLSTSGAAPTPREAATCVIDPMNNRMIVFGGYDQTTSARNDVWELDLNTLIWTQLFPSGTSPSARYAHSAVYDQVGHRMVVFGGTAPYVSAFNDVWELDLTDGAEAWQQLSPAGPFPVGRSRHFCAHDPSTNDMIIGFGYDSDGMSIWIYNDVWVLDLGSLEWRDVSNGGFAITARRGAAAAFFPQDQCTYVYGGHVLGSQYRYETYRLDLEPISITEYETNKVFDTEYLTVETNPNRGSVRMDLYIPEPEVITLRIIDVSGRVVSTLIDRMRYSGHCITVWEGADDQNNQLPAGTYFGVLEMDDKMVVKKAVVVK